MTHKQEFDRCYNIGYSFAKMGGIEQNIPKYLTGQLDRQWGQWELRAAYGGHEDYLAENAFPPRI